MLVALGGTLVAVGVPAFFRDLSASRLAEPLDGLRRIAVAAEAYALAREGKFPPSVGWTPKEVPAGEAVKDPLGTWDDETWAALGFGFTRAHYYCFSFSSRSQQTRYVAKARGDLDGDGQLSEFVLRGKLQGAEVVTQPIEMYREVE